MPAKRTPRTAQNVSDWRSYSEPTLTALQESLLAALVKFGYHGATVRMLAAHADLTVPGLYYHYASKQEILSDLLHASIDELLHRSNLAASDSPESPAERVTLQIENAVLFMTNRYQQRLLTSREVFNLSGDDRKNYLEKRTKMEQNLSAGIEAGLREGKFVQDDPADATRALFDMCSGVALWYTKSTPQSPQEIASRYANYGLRMLRG